MTQRNIHGEWTMSFENRILYSKITGSTNKEASQAWFEEIKAYVLASSSGDIQPWVILNDARLWDMAPQDVSDTNERIANWMKEHHCLCHCLIFSNKVQSFGPKKEISNRGFYQYFFDYDEAYQTCLDKLAEAQGSKDK